MEAADMIVRELKEAGVDECGTEGGYVWIRARGRLLTIGAEYGASLTAEVRSESGTEYDGPSDEEMARGINKNLDYLQRHNYSAYREMKHKLGL